MITNEITTATVWAAAVAREMRKPSERRLDQVRERRLADPAERQGRDRDAELGRGEVRVEMVGGPEQGLGVGPPLRDEFGDPAPAHRHQGELGGHEEAVGQHQAEDREKAQAGCPSIVGNRHLLVHTAAQT